MLELLKKKQKENKLHAFQHVTPVHYPASVREWKNSIYFYNKSNLNLIPYASSQAIKLIKLFFSLYSFKLERNLRRKILQHRKKRLSSFRIFLSNGEFKHKNNNVLINIYIYNKQMKVILSKFRKDFINTLFEKRNIENIVNRYRKTMDIYENKRKNVLKKNLLNSIKLEYKDKSLLMALINNFYKNKRIVEVKPDLVLLDEEKKNTDLENFKQEYKDALKTEINQNIIKTKIKKNLIRTKMLSLRTYVKLIFYHKCKLNYLGLRLLKRELQKLYNKPVDLNIVNLNRFYLNSDILYESVKIKLTKNRRKMRVFLKKLEKKVIVFIRRKVQYTAPKLNFEINGLGNHVSLKNYVFKKLKYKHVTGFRLEAKGRLTRRNTASRSAHKLNYSGNLLNIDSSILGLSSVVLKGNLRSNLQYTKIKSQTRIGSFGLKGWISGY